jgi:hypothetical protein
MTPSPGGAVIGYFIMLISLGGLGRKLFDPSHAINRRGYRRSARTSKKRRVRLWISSVRKIVDRAGDDGCLMGPPHAISRPRK